MADEKKMEKVPTASELQLQSLQAENATLKAELAKAAATQPAVKPVEAKTSGTFVSTRPHYRLGRYYLAGEHIVIKDEVPGKTWERVDEGKPAPAVHAESAHTLRPSDRPII